MRMQQSNSGYPIQRHPHSQQLPPQQQQQYYPPMSQQPQQLSATQSMGRLPVSVHTNRQSHILQSPPSQVNSMSYLHPDQQLSGFVESRANMLSPSQSAARLRTQPPLFSNNYVNDAAASAYSVPTTAMKPSHSQLAFSQSRYQTPLQSNIPVQTYANQPVPATHPIYKQTPYAESGYPSYQQQSQGGSASLYHPATFEAATIANQIKTTSILRTHSTGVNAAAAAASGLATRPSEIAALNEVQLDRVKVYKPQNIERVFGRDVTFDCNYEPLKLFSTKDLRGFLVNGFEDFEKNLRRLEANFTGLESSFFHLLHKAESPKEIFDRFLIALDRRIEKFFEAFNEIVVQQRGGPNNEFFDVHVLRNDFEFWNFKAVIKQGIVEVSNRVNDLFLSRDNSSFYDAQVMRAMETITRIFGFLKTDLNAVLHKSVLKYGRILELCTYDFQSGDALKSVNFAEFVQLDVASIVQAFHDDFERSYPVLLNKKQIITQKFHEILRDKSTQNAFDLKQLVRSVFSRERRKVYSTIYNVIAKNGRSDFGLSAELERENKVITEKMNKIKEKFLELKVDPLYLEVLSGRVNVDAIRNSQTLFEDNPQGVLLLETFMVSVQQLIEDIRSALSDIVRYKETEQNHFKDSFTNILSNAVYDLSQQEKLVQERGDMSEFMLQQFQTLEKALNSDNLRENVDSTIDAKLFSQLKQSSGNYHLHNIAAEFAREGKEKDQKRAVMEENQKRKTKEYSQQIANLMTKPTIDKERTQHPTKEYSREYEKANKAANGDVKGLADKLLESIRERREEEMQREIRAREEQEEIRLMKEQSMRDEKERLKAERSRAAELTEKKFKERREKEQAELEDRISQRQQENDVRKQKEQDRLNQREYEKAREEDNRKRAREEAENERVRKQREKELADERRREDDLKQQEAAQDRIRQKKEEDEAKKRQRDEEDRLRKAKADEDAARRKKEADDEERRKKEKREEDARKAKEDDDRRRKEDEERRKRDEEDRVRRLEEEDRKRKQKEDDDRKRKEDDARRRKEEDDRRKQEDDDRRRKKEDDDRKKKEDDDRKKKEDDERRRQEDEDRRRKKEDDDDRKRKEDDERRKKEDDDRKAKKEEDDRRRKEEDDRRKKDEDDRRAKKEEDDRRAKEEADRKKREDDDRRKKEDDDRRRKELEDEQKRKQKQEEEDRIRREQEEEEDAELERQAEQKRKDDAEKEKSKGKKQSGIDYNNLDDSEQSEDKYKYDFDDDDFDIDQPAVKKADASKPKSGQQNLYDEISEDSGNLDLIVGKIDLNKNSKPDTKKKQDALDEFDYDFDDDFQAKNTKNPSSSRLQNAAGAKGGSAAAAAPKQSERFSYDNDENFDIDDDEDEKQPAGKANAAAKDEYDFEYDEEIEEDIDDNFGMSGKSAAKAGTSKNAKPAGTAAATAAESGKGKYDQAFDLDDEDEEAEDALAQKQKPKNPSPAKKDNKKNDVDIDDDFDYDYEMPEDIPEDGDDSNIDNLDDKEGGATGKAKQQQAASVPQPLNPNEMTKEEMEEYMMQQAQEQYEETYALIEKTNEYVKKTKFGRTNHVNLSRFNNFEAIIRLYEEYIQNLQVFLFNVTEGDKLIELFEAHINQEEYFEELAGQFSTSLQENYYQSTNLTDFSPTTKLYFSLQPNQFGFQLIEVNIPEQVISYFYMVEDDEEENLMEQLQEFHGFLCATLNTDSFQAAPVKIEDNTLKVLQIYDQEPFLQYMIMLFPLVYEMFLEVPSITVTQATIERIFYISLSLEKFYHDLEQDQEAVNKKFNGLLDSFQNYEAYEFMQTQYDDLSEETLQMLLQDLNAMQMKVIEEDSKKYGLGYFEIIIDQNPYCYYFYVHKAADAETGKHQIGLFCLQMYDSINNHVIHTVQQLIDETCDYQPQVEPARHNGLYEYREFTISSWTHLIEKKKLSPYVAINIINFSMIPYYIVYQNLD